MISAGQWMYSGPFAACPPLNFATRSDSEAFTNTFGMEAYSDEPIIPTDQVAFFARNNLDVLTSPDADSPDANIAAFVLDLTTPTGPYPGWWLDQDGALLSDIERDLAVLADDNDAYGWLMMTQAASYAPWSFNWSAADTYYDPDRSGDQKVWFKLAQSAAAKFSQTGDPIWAVAYFLVTPPGRHNAQPSFDIGVWHREQTRQVLNCLASQADYIAWAIATYELARIQPARKLNSNWYAVPPTLRDSIARNAVIRSAQEGYWAWREDDATDDFLDLSDDPNFGTWFRAWLSFRAGTVEDFIAVHKGHHLGPTAFRIANVFATDDILRIARARKSEEQDYRQFLTAAFFRYFALEQDAKAVALIPEIAALWPEQKPYIYSIEKSDASDAVKLARIAQAFDRSSAHYQPNTAILPTRDHLYRSYQTDAAVFRWKWSRRSFDLGREFRQASSLQADFETWGFHPTRDERILGPGYMHMSLHRSYQRRLSLQASGMEHFPKLLIDRAHFWRQSYKVSNLIAWEELTQLGPETGLAHRIATVLIDNATHETSSWWRRFLADRDKLAQEMHDIIHMARKMHSGSVRFPSDGHDHFKPVGQLAFELLKGPLGETAIGRKIHYWHICRDSCEAP